MEAVIPRTLEITVLSAENLSLDRKPVAKNAYVVVRPESINCYTTAMAPEGGGANPSWKQKFEVGMPKHARSITFEVKCKTAVGVKDVGVARIALSDFLGGVVPESCLQFLSYRLRDWEGRRNGIINFSVTVKSPEYSSPVAKPVVKERTTTPCGFQTRKAPLDERNPNGTVIGIPVWANNYASNV